MEERERVVGSSVPGTVAARELSDVTDRAVSALAEAAFAECEEKWAVIALGAYGANRLLPYSDIDLLVLAETPSQKLKPYVEGLLYPLWDTGIDVGHQVRSRAEHLKQSAADIEILTSSLTGRILAGDREYATDALGEVARRAHRRRRHVLASLAARQRPGSPYLLEPDLKAGIGGQRDIDELVWRAAVLGAAPSHDCTGLVELGVLTHEQAALVQGAQDHLTGTRWRVQTSLKRNSSRVTLDLADEVGLDGLHEALADVAIVLDGVRGILPTVDPDPWDGQRLFSALAEGTRALPTLESAAFMGRLDALIPGMSALMVLRRPGLGHRYTVGAHMLRAAALVAGIGADDPIAAEALRAPGDVRPLLVAALTHDAGKETAGPGHAERGVPAARALAEAVGIDPRATAMAERLVREHLLLAETAATSDTDDDDVILSVAARVGDAATLGALYILTAVDSLATGPGAWTRWHAALVRDLLSTVDGALADPEASKMAERANLVRAEVLEALPAKSPLAPIIHAMPSRYLSGHTASVVIAQAGLLADVGAKGTDRALAIGVASGSVAGTYRVTVATPDRPGLFATVAGCLTLAGLDIMDAELYTIGLTALDRFVVGSATDASIEHHTWNRFERELRAALNGNLALETRLAKRRLHYDRRTCSRPVRVESDTRSARVTTLHVTAPDRVGLLYDIAAEVSDAEIDIVRVRALVKDGVAQDVFLLTDVDGQAPRDPGVLGHLAMRIRERCSKA